jgi:hypothetical protein
MSASSKTKILLAFRSGDMCALPDCERKGRRLTVDNPGGSPTNLGQAAHIEGENAGTSKKPASARYNPKMSPAERDAFENLIYLCGSCHKKIDTLPEGEVSYPVKKLKKIKAEHEAKARQAMLDAFSEVGFPELAEATQWATAIQPSAVTQRYDLLELEDKIKKNDLDSGARAVIATGLGVAHEVTQYIQSVAQTDPEFPERLTAGCLAEYWSLKQKGFKGGELFEFMCRFAQRGFERQAQRSAGLAVLIHLFEACEVFEK